MGEGEWGKCFSNIQDGTHPPEGDNVGRLLLGTLFPRLGQTIFPFRRDCVKKGMRIDHLTRLYSMFLDTPYNTSDGSVS